MPKSLVIVESPAKAKTIEKFLGKDFQVLASYGHIRDLPSKDGSVDVEHGFVPKYVVSTKAKKPLRELKQAAKNAAELILATDPDREGEAIAWHLVQELKKEIAQSEVKRVVFHEITKDAVQQALAEPRDVSENLVLAQQARRILDYLVGFNLSPVLWRKIPGSRSAGRVQSVALRLICEREEEIESFQPREYWTIEADLAARDAERFSARLHAVDGKKLDKFAIGSAGDAADLVSAIRNQNFQVEKISKSEKKRNPAAPFTTSTLQQEANRKLGFSARRTMAIAQRLYEGVDIGEGPVGLITYMRTDSVTLSQTATTEGRELITELFGAEYALAKPRVFRSKAKNAQEAHEAIRPTSLFRRPDQIKSFLSPEEYKLYRLVWERTVASQMAAAILDATTVDILAGEKHLFRATGQVVRFPGFMKLYIEGKDQESEDKEGTLPRLDEGQKLTLVNLRDEAHVTQPPPRYTEASLVKMLEENGIGRPSTYASIMNTLVERKYVRLEKRIFFPEDLGREVNRYLVHGFPRYVDVEFTAHMEEDLDAISLGEKDWQEFLQNFWGPFKEQVDTPPGYPELKECGRDCPLCGKPLLQRYGRNGYFCGCSGYPECSHTEPVDSSRKEEPVESGESCEKCGASMLIKDGRFGKYLACSAFPDCRNTLPLKKPKGLGINCPSCKEGELMEKTSRRGKIFYSCNRYPKCKYALWDRPVAEPCPLCGFPLQVEKTTKRQGTVRRCPQENCTFQEAAPSDEA